MEEELYDRIPGEIFCTFRTNLSARYRVPETALNIQTNMNEKSLSIMLTELLNSESDEELPQGLRFEFMINDDFLRGTIKSHMLKHSISSEGTITIYYCLALNEPKKQDEISVEDWVAAISSSGEFYGVGLMNGDLSLYNQENKNVLNAKIYDKQMNCLKIFEHGSKNIALCGFSDERIRVHEVVKQKKGFSTNELCLAEGHEGSVLAIDVNPLDPTIYCSGGFDHTLNLWKLGEKELEANGSAAGEAGARKKVKLAVRKLAPMSRNTIHFDAISSCIWAQDNKIITGSYDHTIKLFDSEKLYETQTINCKDSAVTGLSYANNLIISGHEDAYIKAWDPRANDTAPVKIYKAHNIWISQIRSLESNQNVFVSGAYDNNVKVWDLRSSYPLFSIKTHTDRVFSVEWRGDETILSGGSDSKVAVHRLAEAAN